MLPRGILFDLDGTLVNRQNTLDVFANELATTYEEDLHDFDTTEFLHIIREADGKGYRPKEAVFQDVIQQLPWITPPTVEDLSDFWYTTYPKCAQPMKDAYDVLETLKTRGFKLGLITNGTERSQMGKIERLDLHAYFETIVISETAGIKKPDPEIFKMALNDLNLKASEAYYVGDHPTNDIAGAETIGITGIWLSGHLPWPQNTPAPKHPINRLVQLLHLIDKEDT
jgi:HAD superfamily hydrolase (TIGR01549 family)